MSLLVNITHGRYHIACGDSRARLECSQCERRFKSTSHLTYHVRSVHTQERPYQCPDCQKSFHQLVKLKRHRLQHTGERPFSCEVCGKTFKTRYHMKEHRVIHLARDHHYGCSQCGRKFSDKNNLRRHWKTLHDSTSLLQCSECGLTCGSKFQYDSHLATAHPGPGHLSCPACGKRFKTKKDLDRHQLTHSKVKPFACLQCHKGFSRKDHLKRHMLRVHGVGEVFEVLIEKETEENVDDPMELAVEEEENLLVTVPVTTNSTTTTTTPVVSELMDKRMPKMVGSINELPEDIYNVGFASLLQDIPEPRLLEALMRVEPRHFQTINSILASGDLGRDNPGVTREAVRALLTNISSGGGSGGGNTRSSSQNPAVKKTLLNRYRNQSGLEEEDHHDHHDHHHHNHHLQPQHQQNFPPMNVSEEQRLAASRALSRWLQENRE